jgi:hypothetical protein
MLLTRPAGELRDGFPVERRASGGCEIEYRESGWTVRNNYVCAQQVVDRHNEGCCVGAGRERPFKRGSLETVPGECFWERSKTTEWLFVQRGYELVPGWCSDTG